jgi:glycosyltransferase involved in cell wall biosynthesis
MRVLLTSEARFERTPDSVIWAAASCSSAMWTRYLDVFSSVLIAARVADVEEPSPGCVPASAPGVAFCALPPYSGLSGLVRSSRSVHAVVTHALRGCPAVILRTPSPVAYLAGRAMVTMGRAYGAQVVGDPDQVFSSGAFRHPLRVPLRHAATAAQRLVAWHAHAAMYVTMRTLQQKYPTSGFAYSGSDVSLDQTAFVAARPVRPAVGEPFTFINVASLDQPYKGTSVLLEAFRRVCNQASDVKLLIVGSGALMERFQSEAAALGLQQQVEFLGQLDRDGVRRALDRAQLFVLPSLTEGLPRALLEAMARRLPSVATTVGGIPELLPASCLVAPKDVKGLAERLLALLHDEREREALAERNQRVAATYHERLQEPVRRAFLHAVRHAAAASLGEAACA